MGKIYKRYTHNGNFVKEETENSIPPPNSPSLDEQNSMMDGTEIITGNKDNPPNVKKQDVRPTKAPDTFEEHFNSYIQPPDEPDNEPPAKPTPPARRKETHEEQARQLGFTDLPTNLAHSLISWTKSGRPVVTAEQWNTRLSVCRGCQFWSENKTTNHAKCMKCGCGSGKLLLTQSKCPLNPPKWTSL